MENLEDKIIKETYKSIENEEYRYLIIASNSLGQRIKNIFNRIRLYVTSMVQEYKYKKAIALNDTNRNGKIYIIVDDDCDLDAETEEIPVDKINEEVYTEQRNYSKPVFIDLKGKNNPNKNNDQEIDIIDISR